MTNGGQGACAYVCVCGFKNIHIHTHTYAHTYTVAALVSLANSSDVVSPFHTHTHAYVTSFEEMTRATKNGMQHELFSMATLTLETLSSFEGAFKCQPDAELSFNVDFLTWLMKLDSSAQVRAATLFYVHTDACAREA